MTSVRPAVVVTGASTGIGKTIALRLVREGFTVFAGVRHGSDVTVLTEEAGADLRPLLIDVTKPDQIGTAARHVAEAVGDRGLAGLVNNAGIALGGPLEFIPIDWVREQFEVNVFGLLAVTQAFLPALRIARGRIVNIGSIAGLTTTPMVTPYSMSKYAVESLSDGLRRELRTSGVFTTVIEPGAIKTPIWAKGTAFLGRAERSLPAAALERYGDRLTFFGKLLKRNGERGADPASVADAVVHALTAKRPRTRYLVGTDAKIRAWLARLLPDRAYDALIERVLARLERRLA